MPGPVSDQFKGSRGNTPYVLSWMEPMADAVIEVLPNDNEKVREDRRGRINVSHRRTWVVAVDGEAFREFNTKHEASEYAAIVRATRKTP